MSLHAALPRPALGAWWAALVVVPLALAGLGLALFPLSTASPLSTSLRSWGGDKFD